MILGLPPIHFLSFMFVISWLLFVFDTLDSFSLIKCFANNIHMLWIPSVYAPSEHIGPNRIVTMWEPSIHISVRQPIFISCISSSMLPLYIHISHSYMAQLLALTGTNTPFLWPLARYLKLWVAHSPGMPGTFSPHRGLAILACITARAWSTCRDACRGR